MNYYEHHIGDYDKNTSHLTACEDGIYSRMIRRYLDKERALDADVSKIERLVRARSKEEKQAVHDVLDEFFELQEDGWHNKTCDEVISVYQAGEPEREAKKANEDNRMKRHREERARLFKVVTDAGQHAPWNIGMTELRELVKRLTKTSPETAESHSPETPPATAPETPATATQYPIPIPQTPLPNTQRIEDSVPNGTGGKPPLITDPDEIIFGYGLALLTNAGTADKQARSFLGGLRKHHGDDALIDALRNCAKAKPLQPLEWLAAALPPGKRGVSTARPGAMTDAQRTAANASATQEAERLLFGSKQPEGEVLDAAQ